MSMLGQTWRQARAVCRHGHQPSVQAQPAAVCSTQHTGAAALQCLGKHRLCSAVNTAGCWNNSASAQFRYEQVLDRKRVILLAQAVCSTVMI